MIRVLVFDLGSVCFHIDWNKINEEVVRKFGVSILVKQSNNQKAIDLYNGASEGRNKPIALFEELAKDKANPVELMNYYKEMYKKYKTPNLEIIKILKKLKGKYKLVCLSDTNELHWEAHKEQNSLDYFDNCFFSFQLKSRKQDKHTFLKILDSLKESPANVLFIDDNEQNIDNARSLGFNTILFKDNKSFIEQLKIFNIID